MSLPPATLDLYAAFKAHYRNPNLRDPKLVRDLAAAPDGDLCFLTSGIQDDGGYEFIAAREALGKLNTQRTFDRLISMLDSSRFRDRSAAMDLLANWHRPEAVPKLLERLRADTSWEQSKAINALEKYDDPRIDPAIFNLIDDAGQAGFDARRVLALRHYTPAYNKIVADLQIAPAGGERDQAIANISAYRRPESVELLLAEIRRLEQTDDNRKAFSLTWTGYRLRECLAAAHPLLGLWPDDRADEWQDYWDRARPLLDDNLQLKQPLVPTSKPGFTSDQFATNIDSVNFTASVDQENYRVGDPIVLRLELKNTGDKPVSTILPRLPSGWMPTMAYGIKLTGPQQVLFNIQPSDMYQGSYSGAPGFQTLGPGESFKSSICLQYWLEDRIDEPMPQGDYEIEIIFDSAKFAGVRAIGVQQLHRWITPPVHFSVAGPARQDAQDVLSYIGEITSNKFLISDLSSTNNERRSAAWDDVREFGDSRLNGYVRQVELDSSFQFKPLNGSVLRPFTQVGRGPMFH